MFRSFWSRPGSGADVAGWAGRCLLWVFGLLALCGAPEARSQGDIQIVPSGGPGVAWRAAFAGVAGTASFLDGGVSAGGVSVARFNTPTGMAAGPNGEVYVADTLNHVIRRIMPDGAVSLYAGVPNTAGSADSVIERVSTVVTEAGASLLSVRLTGGETAASLGIQPGTLILGPSLVSGTKVSAVSADQLVLTLSVAPLQSLSGSYTFRTVVPASFNGPRGVVVDGAGNVYVADTGNHLIRKISKDQTVTTVAGVRGTGAFADGPFATARFSQPHAVALIPPPAGSTDFTLVVADTGNHRIRSITQTGVTTVAGEGTPGFFDGSGSVAKFSSPKGLAVLSINGVTEMYVADSGNHAIRKIVMNASVFTVSSVAGVSGGSLLGAGRVDGLLNQAKLNGPLGITGVGPGRLLVTETDNHTIRGLDLVGGSVSSIGGQFEMPGAQDGVGVGSKFNIPSGVVVASQGRIYVSNAGSHVISVGQVPIADAYVWSVFAGSVGGPGVSDGPSGVARFTAPSGLARNPATGDVFVIDGQAIRRISPSGQVTLFAGVPGQRGSSDSPVGGVSMGSTGHPARFNDPAALAWDASAGALYVADYGNKLLRKVTASGIVSTVPLGITPFSIGGIAVSPDAGSGTVIYLSNQSNNTILKVSSTGTVLSTFALTRERGGFAFPGALALRGNDLFFADPALGQIFKLNVSNPSQLPIQVAGAVDSPGGGYLDSTDPLEARFDVPVGLQVDSDGNVYVADLNNHCIRRIGLNGVDTYAGRPTDPGFANGAGIGSSPGGGIAKFSKPGGLLLVPGAAGGAGRILVADTRNFSIRAVAMDAGRKVSTFCGVPVETGVTNGPAIGPRFSGLDLENEEVGAAVLGMSGVAVDAGGGVVYVSDPSNHVIRRVQGGQVTTFVGIVGQSGYEEGSAAEARLNQPKGMVVDPAGNLYVADFGNHAIRKVSLNGVVSTVAGLGPDGAGSTDGGLGEGALNGPVALAIDASGKLYVADQGNDLIRRLVPTTAQQSTVFNLETVAGLRGIDSVLDGPVESAAFSLPSAIAMSPDGQKIYVSDQSENVPLIRLVDLQAGQVSLVHELPQPDIVAAGNAPYFPDEALPNLPLVGGIAIDPSGGLIVTSTFDSAVYRIPLDGGPLVQIGGADVMDPLLGGEPGNRGGSGTDSRFFVPAGVAVAGNGAVYVANAGAASLVSAVPPSQTVPALTSPVSDAVLSGSISVAFTLPERAQPGSLRVLFKSRAASREVVVSDTLGVAGNASLTIQASNPGGSFNVSGVVPAGAKIPSGVYTVQVVYRSQSGQLRQSPIANRVSIDAETGLPKLLSPAARATFTANVPVSFVLPEAAAAGSLNLVFDDGFNPRTLVLAGSQETAGNHSFDLNPQEPLNGGFVVSGDPVPPGSYKVSLFYRDQQMNDEAVATSSGVLIRGTQPVLVLPQANTVSRAPVPVQFSLPAPAKAGTLRLRFTNSSSEVRELVLGSVLERLGGRFDFDPASPAGSSTAVVSGPSIPDGEYSVQVNYQSALGAQTIGPVAGFRIDTVTQPPTGLTFSDVSPGAAQIQFTLPEAAQEGSVIAAFRPVGGTGSVPKLVLGEQNESAGLHTVQVDLRDPEANTAQIRGGDPVPNGVYELVVAYNDVLGNPRAFARTSATVVNGAELIPFRVGYGRQGSGTPLIFTFTLSAQASSPIARLVFRKEDTQEVSELVLARSFSNGVESTVGFDPANTALGGQFSSGPAILLPGTYGVRLKYARSDSSEATSRELTGVRVLSGVSVGSPQIAVESGVLTGTRLSKDPQGSPFFGFSFLRFGVPSSTGDGGLAYQATYVNPSRERFRGVFVSDSVEPIAVQRGEAPGAGISYLLFGTPVVNRSGDLAFAALLDAENPESGLWVRRSGVLSLVFRASQPVIGSSASRVFLDGVTNIALADNGDLFFTALRSEPVPEGTDPEDEEVVPQVFSLWRQNSSGQIAQLLSTGSLIGVGSGQDRMVNKITAFGAMPDTPGQRRGFNKNGDLVVRVDFTDQTAALVKFTSGSLTPVVVLKTGSQNLAGESVNIGNLGLVSLGDDGGMVVRIGLVQDGTGVTPDNDQMLVAISNTSVATILAQEGDQITAGGSAVVLKSVGNPVGGQAGGYAFVGSISAVPAEGQTTSPVADPVILRKNGSGFDILARRGGTVPGVTGAQFNQIRSLAWPGNGGDYGPAFVASLKAGGGVTSANDVGLWAQNSGGTVVLLLREGDTLLSGADKKTVRLFSVLSAVSGSASQGHSTVGEGTYAVRVVFTDLTEAVINVSVP